MIKVSGITKKYNDHVAVDGLSFELKENKIYGLLGANGAGKSTTMNIITGYLAPTAGSVYIGDYDMSKDSGKAKSMIGYLPEIPPLYPEMTVYEYMNFVAELKNIKKTNKVEELERVLAEVGLHEVKTRLIRNLSKGYKQRVGFAQALLGNPDIIILDEPTVGLDPVQIIEIRNLIKSLGKDHTVVLSSHILSEVQAVCDEILIISHGHLVASDTPENLEKLMDNKNAISITVKGSQGLFKQVIDKIDGLSLVQLSELSSGCLRAELESASQVDLREELFYMLAENKLPIMEMVHNSASLEDVFIELTSDNCVEEVEE